MMRWFCFLFLVGFTHFLTARDTLQMLVVYPDSLHASVEEYQAYRSTQPLDIHLLPLSHVGHMPNAYELKNHFQSIRDTFAFTHLLLIGSLRHLPILQSTTSAYTDHFYAKLDNDSLPNVAVGRLPVHTNREMRTYRQKVEGYFNRADTNSPQALLIHGPSEADRKTADSARYWLGQHGFGITNVFGNEPSRGNGLQVDKPTDLVFHIGLGVASGWMDVPQRVTTKTARDLNQPVFQTIISVACSTAGPQFRRTLAETLLFHPYGGTLSYIGCTGNCLVRWADALGLAILRSTGTAATIGEAFLEGKQQYQQQNATADPFKVRHTLEQMILLGDPSLPVKRKHP